MLLGRVLAGVLGEGRRRDEEPLVRADARERADEGLHVRAPDRVLGLPALRLNVDLAETQPVLADDAVDAAVPGLLGHGGRVGLHVAVAHGAQQVDDQRLEERRGLLHDGVELSSASFWRISAIEDSMVSLGDSAPAGPWSLPEGFGLLPRPLPGSIFPRAWSRTYR